MKKILAALSLVFAVLASPTNAQPVGGPGPGPAPDPWVLNGSAISYNGCVLVPSSVSGGCKGNGTINATVLYQAGFAVLSTDLANGKLLVGNGSGAASPVTPSGDLTMTNAGVFTVGANAIGNSKLAQAAAVTLKGNPTASLANVQDFTLSGLTALASPNTTLDLLLIWDHTAGTFKSATPAALSTAVGGITALTGDLTATGPGSVTATLATVNSNVGTFGSATAVGQFTVNGKGLITAAGNVTVTPAIGSVTGLGTGIATALGVNVGSAGAPVLFNGAGGTPSSLVGTNITGTASGLTAGNVTTNANLTGDVTSVGNATTLANVPNGVAVAGTMLATNVAAPSSPTSGKTSTWADSTDLRFHDKNASGVIGTTVVADTGAANNYISAISVAGVITKSRPACVTLSDASALCASTDAANLTGTVASARVVGSYTSITGVGTLAAGTLGSGVTIQASNVTYTGTVPAANLPVVADASGSPSATSGIMKCDGTTTNCAGGVVSAIGGVATSVAIGTTTITSGTSGRVLFDNAGVFGEKTVVGSGASVPLVDGTPVIATGKTFTVSNSMTQTATDGSTVAFGAGGTVTYTIASGAKALATGAISSAACTSAQTATATGTVTTDTVMASFNGDPTAVTGYVPLTTGMLTIIAYPTADTVNFKVCNNTNASITPGAVTINWRVSR